MEGEVSYAIDIAASILIIVLFLPMFMVTASMCYSGDFGGFDKVSDKTALYTNREIIPPDQGVTRNDVVLTMSVADRFMSSPRRVNINSQAFKIDEEFLKNKEEELVRTYTAFDNNTDVYDWKLVVDGIGPVRWELEKRP